MKLTIKNSIFENRQFQAALSKIRQSALLSAKELYDTIKLVKNLTTLAEEYTEVKNNLIEKHSSGNRKSIEPGDPNRAAFDKDMNIVLKQDVELNRDRKIKLAFRANFLTANDILALEPIFEIDFPEEIIDKPKKKKKVKKVKNQ